MGSRAVFGKAFRSVVVSSLLAGGLAVALPAGPAAAATARNGVCESGEFCLYYLWDGAGSVSDFATSISNYGSTQPTCYEFRGPGAGQGQCVKNNAWSAWNRSSRAVTVYYNSGYSGANQTYASGQKSNLSWTLQDNNASHKFR